MRGGYKAQAQCSKEGPGTHKVAKADSVDSLLAEPLLTKLLGQASRVPDNPCLPKSNA